MERLQPMASNNTLRSSTFVEAKKVNRLEIFTSLVQNYVELEGKLGEMMAKCQVVFSKKK